MKTILMSGYNSDPEVRRNAAAGTIPLLDKPLEISSLAGALRGTLDRPGKATEEI